MKYLREEYERFLLTEIDAQQNTYNDIVCTRALTLKDRGDIFVGKYLAEQGDGIMIFKIRRSASMPRKNSYWTACYLSDEMGSFRNWGTLSWVELRQTYQRKYCEVFCAWISNAEEPDFCLVGIKGITLEFADLLKEDKPIIAFGPKDPPLRYLFNLLTLIQDSSDKRVAEILDFEDDKLQWNPILITAQENFSETLDSQLNENQAVIVQGPPGVGKTFRIAQYASSLIAEGKSVLVTALTNQALMEVAEKDSIRKFLDLGCVSKTSLTIDEQKKMPKLLSVQENRCNAKSGKLTLATFYVSSGWANEVEVPPFDYVFMDEASQALLPMIAATMKLGTKIIWIGDQHQLPPIVTMVDDLIERRDWGGIVFGFNTLCSNFRYKKYMLCDTYRLTLRGAEATGKFYNNKLSSVSGYTHIPSILDFTNRKGGPVVVKLNLSVGDVCPSNASDWILDKVNLLLKENPKTSVAILSKFRDTARKLQAYYLAQNNIRDVPDTLKIETVDRVQGLTVDYCFYLIPNTSLKYSFNEHLFNVATSRARYNTFIIVDCLAVRSSMPQVIRDYFNVAERD